MRSQFRKYVILSLVFPILVLPASATNCFTVPTFQALKRVVSNLYTEQIPRRIVSELRISPYKSSISMQRQGSVDFPRTLYKYGLEVNFKPNGQFSEGELFVEQSFRGRSDVSGGWAKLLGYEEMVEEVRRIEDELGALADPNINRYLPQKITHSPVANRWLEPKIRSHISDFATAVDQNGNLYVDVMPDTDFFKELTSHIPKNEATNLQIPSGHNGTQTLRFVKLLKAQSGSSLNIQKIRLRQSSALSVIDSVISMVFYLEE